MAEKFHFPSLLFLLALLSASPVLSRNLSPRSTGSAHTTATLDVSSSLDQALRVLSFEPHQTVEQDMKSLHRVGGGASSSGGLTLELHSRDFLPSAAHVRPTDYKTLTLDRLNRDSARVKSIAARLALATHGVKRSDLKPVTEEKEFATSAEAIRGPIVSGSSQGSGEYFSRLGIGSPPKPLYMVLDTGSDVTWVQCEPCADCYQQSDPVFDPSASSSYSTLPCDSPRCRALDISACRNSSGVGAGSSCLYQVSYGDGSYTVGDFATETVTLGDSAPVTSVAIGCGHDNEGLFVGAAGLLALGGGPLSFPTQISARSFSYCLVDRDSPASSTLELGDGAASGAAVAAPLLRNRKLDTFYYVGLSGISVGGEMLSIPPSSFAMDESGSGGVIVDSGTAVTRLQSEAYGVLRDAFRQGTSELPAAAGVSLFDTCYDLSSRTSVEVPTVAFHFPEGRELRLPAKNYLIPVDGVGTYCLAFAPTTAPLSIIGNVQQQGTRVSFDLDNAVMGFTSNNC